MLKVLLVNDKNIVGIEKLDKKNDNTQTEAKLKRDEISSEKEANETHYNTGREVRDTIKRLGGTMPEELPTPKKSLKELEKESNSDLLKI